MSSRYFTVNEANDVIAEINPLMEELQERRSRIVSKREAIKEMLKSDRSDVGGPEASSLIPDFIAIERIAREIRSHGCILKDLNAGLVDFLSERNGRDVFLCWRFGEPSVSFFHELHTGFRGRRRI